MGQQDEPDSIWSSKRLTREIVRTPMLTDGSKTGRIKVGMVGKGIVPRINRADMANYILKQVQSREQVGKAPAISN